MPKILVVDDEKFLRGALKDALSSEGYEVIEAENGVKGLELALSAHPDLILLDILMPEVDGVTMLKELRKDYWGEKAKVVLSTNLADEQKIEEVKALGALGYFVKTNWSIEDLMKMVRSYL